MWSQGIQAVGDICNTSDTFSQKEKSPIRYYNFIELFDFLQTEKSEKFITGNLEVFEKAKHPKSVVPHAPYSVSTNLFKKINQLNEPKSTVSIHNQETQEEDDLFRLGKSGFHSFYQNFGFSLDAFQARGSSSIRYALENMDPTNRTLFVHNTLTDTSDMEAAHQWNPEVFWCTCPNANLYIENRLPDYTKFIAADAVMTIGTDSLTSNWQLSVWEEMRTILRFQSYVSFETILTWATLNGARARGMESHLGSLETGKTPGVLNISFHPDTNSFPPIEVNPVRLV
jgi:cytosine/adenosine deaminase-related metal-dependent hydrolase